MYISGLAQNKDAVISVTELKEQMKNDTSLVILDVRLPEELTSSLGKIDSVINIPVQELEDRVGELAPYKNKQIAVICRTGNRSHYATQFLNKHGFKAKNVLGGMVEYRKKFK